MYDCIGMKDLRLIHRQKMHMHMQEYHVRKSNVRGYKKYGFKWAGPYPVLLYGHIGKVDKHVVQFVYTCGVLHSAETTETQLVPAQHTTLDMNGILPTQDSPNHTGMTEHTINAHTTQ